ncbi:hypothetical protein BGZ49_002137 [Haplosporangium sp. Z 27]|nr:hypothetical protein BGZ49_002137 [Haplosporangium sp. Z 27]
MHLGGVLKYIGLRIAGKTAPEPFGIGCGTAFISSSTGRLSHNQYRKFFAFALDDLQKKTGLGNEELRAQWATVVYGKPTDQPQNRVLSDDNPNFLKIAHPRGPQGHTWKGYWIPFQDQVHSVKNVQNQVNYVKKRAEDIKKIKLGENCDLVVFYAHGGGFVDGFPLQTLGFMLKLMKHIQQKHGIKVGFLSIDYSLSPETPFPGALNECIEAYRSLVKDYNVDPKRIILAGESAGGNLAHSISLKIRDEFSDELGLPAGIITISPYFMDPEPMEYSLYDTLTPESCENIIEAYSQHKSEVLNSQYYSALNATTLAGLPPTLVFIAGAEILRPSIEKFVARVKKDGGDIQVHLQEHRCHIWFLIDIASTEKDREECIGITSDFLASVYTK